MLESDGRGASGFDVSGFDDVSLVVRDLQRIAERKSQSIEVQRQERSSLLTNRQRLFRVEREVDLDVLADFRQLPRRRDARILLRVSIHALVAPHCPQTDGQDRQSFQILLHVTPPHKDRLRLEASFSQDHEVARK